MTTLTIAHCPRCGTVDTIFIRDGDNLVCSKICREGRVPPPAPTSFGDGPSRQSLREGAPSVGPSTWRIAPSRRSLRRVS